MTSRKWGNSSREQLNSCTVDVQWLLTQVLLHVADLTVIEGHRNEERQNSLYPKFTKLKYPHGKHNRYPSEAVDVQPYPRPKNNIRLCSSLGYIAGAAKQIGARRGLSVRWGGDWDGDGDVTDQTFDDLFHIEVKREENFRPFSDSELDLLRSVGLNAGER